MSLALAIITTCSSPEEAKQLAHGLVKQKLAACVQLIPISSIYEWEGKISEDQETQLMIKAKQSHYQAIEHFIKENHSYDMPEIIALPIQTGSEEYLGWINNS